jgi:type I restriction enzyme S subunit
MKPNNQRQQVLALFLEKWPMQAPDHALVQQRLADAFDEFLVQGLGDPQFIRQLLSDKEECFAQRLGEIQLAMRMKNAGFTLASKVKGPDLLATKDGRQVWLELITPEPKDLPEEWIRPRNGVQSFPHEKVLLRWTAGIKEKMEKGRSYLDKGIIQPGDPYVIVVNDALLNARGGFLHGISQKPFVVEATLAVGPLQVTIDRNTLEALSTGHQHRTHVINHNQAKVPADTFFDPKYQHVSAVMGTTLHIPDIRDEVWNNQLVHNPRAGMPVPHGFIPAGEEWACKETANQYTVFQLD